MAEERLFGNSIDKAVVDEIKKREKLLSKANTERGNLLPDSTDSLKSIRYTTQKGAWVRMISSVNVDVTEETQEGSALLSQNFILTGGETTTTLYTPTESGLGIRPPIKREGISFTEFDPSKSYRKTATLGVRPEAGITAFSIKHKGTYGSIREAQISFTVWSKEDLNRAQDIYLRPGVHMIVEWGHTMDSEGDPVKLPNENRYFTATSRQQVQEVINAHRKANLSYEGFIGLVTNFSWSFREYGGYDCSVRVISAGAVMEALTLIQGAGKVTSAELVEMGITEESGEQSQSEYKKSIIHSFVRSVKRDPSIFPDSSEEGVVSFSAPISKIKKLSAGGRTVIERTRFSEAVEKILIDNKISLYGFSVGVNSTPTYFRYITIRDLLKFLNACEFFPKAPNGEEAAKFFVEPVSLQEFSKLNRIEQELLAQALGKSIDELEKDYQEFSIYPKFKTFPEHFSLDIKTCFLPKAPSISARVGIQQETEHLNKIALSSPLKDTFLSASHLGESDNVQSILVELDFLLESFDAALSSEEESVYKLNVLSFMQNLLKGINNALGSITDLDLQFDETLQQYIIVDREAVTAKEAVSSVSSLSFTGISNTVQKVSIETKITPLLSSQIAVSSQGTNSIKEGNNNSNLPLIQWNRGIRDRFAGKSSGSTLSPFIARSTQTTQTPPTNFVQAPLFNAGITPGVSSPISTPSYIDRFLKPWADAFQKLIVGQDVGWWMFKTTNTSYKADLFSKLRGFGISYFRQKYFNSIGGEANQDKTSDPGLIPIELSLTLDGIGGLKIGQVFKLDKVETFLPDAYKDYGFIITGIDSTIENNKWSTTIKALTFKIPTESVAASGGSTGPIPTASTTGVRTPIERDDLYAGVKIIVENYLGKSVTDAEFEKFLRAVAAESSPNADERAAIASVILNRVLSPRFTANTLDGVLMQRNQFQAVTGTFANGRQPSSAFLNASPATINAVKRAIVEKLSTYKPQGWLNFTAARRAAYKEGTNVGYLDKALTTPGNRTIGLTVFFTERTA